MSYLKFLETGLVDLPGSLPANHSREIVAPGYLGTYQTIQRMQDMVTLGKRQFQIRKLIGELVQNCPPKDYYCYAKAAHDFCRDKIRYVFDPSGVELIETPARILESKVADCDSIVILMAALCEGMGFPCRFVTIKADSARPNEFSHVFLEVKIPRKGWVGSDPTQPNRPFGWEPGPEYERKNWPASKDAPEDSRESDDMAGLGYGSPVPGVQDTPGVLVEKPWEFRDEPALVVTNPEELELASMLEAKKQAISDMPHREFYYADELDQFALTRPEVVSVSPEAVKTMKGFGEFGAAPKWLLAAGAVALVFWLMRRK